MPKGIGFKLIKLLGIWLHSWLQGCGCMIFRNGKLHPHYEVDQDIAMELTQTYLKHLCPNLMSKCAMRWPKDAWIFKGGVQSLSGRPVHLEQFWLHMSRCKVWELVLNSSNDDMYQYVKACKVIMLKYQGCMNSIKNAFLWRDSQLGLTTRCRRIGEFASPNYGSNYFYFLCV